MKAAADEAAERIIAGDVEVHDYVTEGECPVK